MVTSKSVVADAEELQVVRQQFRDALKVDDLSKLTLDDLYNILDPISALERTDFRRGTSNTSVVAVRPFGTIEEIFEESAPEEEIPIVSLKH